MCWTSLEFKSIFFALVCMEGGAVGMTALVFPARGCVECHLQDKDPPEGCHLKCSAPHVSVNRTAGLYVPAALGRGPQPI